MSSFCILYLYVCNVACNGIDTLYIILVCRILLGVGTRCCVAVRCALIALRLPCICSALEGECDVGLVSRLNGRQGWRRVARGDVVLLSSYAVAVDVGVVRCSFDRSVFVNRSGFSILMMVVHNTLLSFCGFYNPSYYYYYYCVYVLCVLCIIIVYLV